MDTKYRETLRKALNIRHNVFIDYPEGRTKPPVPVISLDDVLDNLTSNVIFFATSNIESGNIASLFKKVMPNGVKFVPKIESARGIENIVDICDKCSPQYIMLDTEDLFTDLNGNIEKFEYYIKKIEDFCSKNNVKIFKINGVVFSD